MSSVCRSLIMLPRKVSLPQIATMFQVNTSGSCRTKFHIHVYSLLGVILTIKKHVLYYLLLPDFKMSFTFLL